MLNNNSYKKVDCTHFFNSIESPTKADVLRLAINTAIEDSSMVRILISTFDLQEIISSGEKQICFSNKGYYELDNVMISEIYYLEKDYFAIITDTNLVIHDKFSEVLTKIIKA